MPTVSRGVILLAGLLLSTAAGQYRDLPLCGSAWTGTSDRSASARWLQAAGQDLERLGRGSYDPNRFRRNQQKYADLITEAARQYLLPDALVHAVITAESAYDPDALSGAGALGLMQLMPATAQRLGVTNRSDPRQNVFGGTRYLRDLLEMFDDNLELALAGYNAGENAVIRYGHQIPPFPETQNYVRKVLQYYHRYREEGVIAGS